MKRRLPTAEELALWQRAMQNTTPLPGRNLVDIHGEGPPSPPRPSRSDKSRTSNSQAGARRPPASSVASPAPATPTQNGLDAATQRRLRRGRAEVDGRVDLHGLSQSEALIALNQFIAESQAAGRRCVLVITGKGGRIADHGDAAFMHRPEDGVLRRRVPQWLSQEPNRSRVFAVESAHSRHGGSGAFYVFLRKAR